MFLPLLLLAVGLPFCFRHRGFSVDKISSKLEYKESWEVEPFLQQEQESLCKQVFSQPFYYLGAGKQCYAFVSEDQHYVLKFFKMHHLMPKNWLNAFPFSLFENYRFNQVDKKKQLLDETFDSFKLAYEHLKHETGLVYIHLNKSRYLKTKVNLIDRNGKNFSIDLDSKEFVLQRKAIPLYSHLLVLTENNEDQRIHQCIRSLLKVVVARCRAGFGDRGIGVRHNYGFIDDQAVIIDCGQFVPDETLAFPHNFHREILRVTEALDLWAHKNCPELIPIIQEEAQQLMNTIDQPD